MMQVSTRNTLYAGGFAMLSALGNPSMAANGHYVPGVEGLKGSVVPPPGIYYRGYLVHYDIDALRDDQGTKLPDSNTGSVSALVNRFIWMTDKKILNADYGMEAIIPLQRTSLDFGIAGIDSTERGVGDVFVSPLVLGWHGQQWDAVAAAGIWLDTGEYSSTEPASIGKGFRTTMLTLGGTYYPDAAKSWSLSALSRYEIKSKQDETGITPGDSWLVEWGVGKQLDNGLELGVIGYNSWQLENSKGAPAGKAEKHALGIEGSYFWPSLMLGLNAAYLNEYEVHNGPSGDMFRLTLTKVF
ncbi:transporter [Oceanimonas baumannii]|uniref:SphA family protein n=1 Tax=Oceanimonas baumannii TaxID=129578 RepID=UPI001D17FA81|nr:transporter [Oceanimonas baumannii]MCC4265990.1 transporter [Oceanimonas baumannii]